MDYMPIPKMEVKLIVANHNDVVNHCRKDVIVELR